MMAIREIPEVVALDARRSQVRIPPEIDVPLTDRVRRLIDTAEFRRLTQISQVGLVSLVYPAANHSRFEHSLGVYRLALQYLNQLSYDERFATAITPADAELFLVSALLHDLGHWPFCHPIEDLRLPDVPHHELLAKRFLFESELSERLRLDWNVDTADVVRLLAEKPVDRKSSILSSLLSGPIDIDKVDYLQRDSLHAGVPYGRHFDQHRLIGSLCLNAAGDGLALSEKGKTAAEMLIFARYIMFSEVYWHHAVRSATAMLQRAFFLLHSKLDLDSLMCCSDSAMIAQVQQAAINRPEAELLDGLFGPKRRLYKRLSQYSYFEQRELYEQLARRPYQWLAECSGHFVELASAALGRTLRPSDVLFDAPPPKREIEFNVEIHFAKDGQYRPLAEVSPIVRTLATEQFDDYVKRVRIFAHPDIIDDLRGLPELPRLIQSAIAKTGQ